MMGSVAGADDWCYEPYQEHDLSRMAMLVRCCSVLRIAHEIVAS